MPPALTAALQQLPRHDALLGQALKSGPVAIGIGGIPVVALSLALTFAFYGFFRKTAKVNSASGLFVETLVLVPLLPTDILRVAAAPSTRADAPYSIQFTCSFPDKKQQLAGAELYVRGDNLTGAAAPIVRLVKVVPTVTVKVSLSGANQIAVIDYRTGNQVATVPTGSFPQRNRLAKIPDSELALAELAAAANAAGRLDLAETAATDWATQAP